MFESQQTDEIQTKVNENTDAEEEEVVVLLLLLWSNSLDSCCCVHEG